MRYDKKGRVLQQKWVQEDKRGKLAEPVEAKRAKKKALDPATYAQDDTKGRGMTRTRRGKTILVGVRLPKIHLRRKGIKQNVMARYI